MLHAFLEMDRRFVSTYGGHPLIKLGVVLFSMMACFVGPSRISDRWLFWKHTKRIHHPLFRNVHSITCYTFAMGLFCSMPRYPRYVTFLVCSLPFNVLHLQLCLQSILHHKVTAERVVSEQACISYLRRAEHVIAFSRQIQHVFLSTDDNQIAYQLKVLEKNFFHHGRFGANEDEWCGRGWTCDVVEPFYIRNLYDATHVCALVLDTGYSLKHILLAFPRHTHSAVCD